VSVENRFFHPPACCDQTVSVPVRYQAYCYAVPLSLAPIVLSILGITGTLSLQTFAIANISVTGFMASVITLAWCVAPDKKEAAIGLGRPLILHVAMVALNALGLLSVLPASALAISTIVVCAAYQIIGALTTSYIDPPSKAIEVDEAEEGSSSSEAEE
jgi:hypothetical protein